MRDAIGILGAASERCPSTPQSDALRHPLKPYIDRLLRGAWCAGGGRSFPALQTTPCRRREAPSIPTGGVGGMRQLPAIGGDRDG